MRPRVRSMAAAVLAVGLVAAARADASPTLADYRYFRSLSIDLRGRMPSRDEIAAFERDGFDIDAWIEQQLATPQYAERIRRVYMDLMRLDIGNSFQFVPGLTALRLVTVNDPDGHPVNVFFRRNQRRQDPHTHAAIDQTDGDFCLPSADTGVEVMPASTTQTVPVTRTNAQYRADWNAYTVEIKPWWLYRDYRAASPTNRFDAASWAAHSPGFAPSRGLNFAPNADGSPSTTPATTVRVCREEAQTAAMGTVFSVAGRHNGTHVDGRATALPVDSTYAAHNAGTAISCTAATSYPMSADCGCGVGLERCLPIGGNSNAFDGSAVNFARDEMLGFDPTTEPFDTADQTPDSWERYWWGQEAAHFLDYVFQNDRDFREVLNARYSFVNGPLAQFYTAVSGATCCTSEISFPNAAGQPMLAPAEPLFDPAAVPHALLPHDTNTWMQVADRGAHASGLLTMPVFLAKFGSRRARAHVLYNAFLCRDFIAPPGLQLPPSTQPDLMLRDGCNTCHATLEPLAAYFTRVLESDWTFLPSSYFPLSASQCANADPMQIPRQCGSFYDPAFTDATHSTLRGAYASHDNAEAGPQGLATWIASQDEFNSCVAQNVAQAFLGRTLSADDAALRTELTQAFSPDPNTRSMRALVRAMVHSDAYRRGNDLTASAWRDESTQGGH